MGFYFDEEQCTCLKYIDTPMVPTAAKTECERNGANLVRIDSNTKQQYIYNLLGEGITFRNIISSLLSEKFLMKGSNKITQL